jgi:hypothetical protein
MAMHGAPRRRREHVITLRLSARERARLYRAAALLGTSGSELLREALAVRLMHAQEVGGGRRPPGAMPQEE